MFAIFKKELHSFFGSATGYIVIGIFLALNGLLLWIIPGEYNILDAGYANADGLFFLAPWLFLFLCPAVTMRCIAEERQTGAWEWLRSKPLSAWAIVGGKYAASLALVLIALLPTVIYYFTVSYIAEPQGNIDAGAFWGSFIGLVFLAAVYVAVGVFASSVANNQIVAFITAVVLSFFMLYGFTLIASVSSTGSIADIIENIGIQKHYNSMSRGVIDLRDILYFLIASFVFLFFTERRISK
ncbi:MAG: gliding motility-associated ABC transporter permease subunit GldF [Paludibacter sp.]|jgi:ABC-2 type transport system permease protein|nr:gliding motility-associated ABC transporter permease subunit GldF [Paludibacter sp.]